MTDTGGDGEAQRAKTQSSGAPISRRGVIRGMGAIGAIGAFGTEAVSGKPGGKRKKRFIVGTKPGKANTARKRAKQVRKVIDFKEVGEAVVGEWPEEALNGLKHNKHVRYVEEEGECTLHAHGGEHLPWGIDRVDAEIAHANGDTASGIDIAILDTGIDSDHPDLQGNLGTGHSPTDCDPSWGTGNCLQDWDDDHGHGTHVAGTADAVDNGRDVIGVSTQATLHAVKVCEQTSDGLGTCPNGDIADGIREAADQGYDVANMSFGSLSKSSAIEDAIDYAEANSDIVLVSSAGNDGAAAACDDDDCVGYPARDSRVIAVSNTQIDDGLRFSSSVGPEVDIAAPGTGILSTTFGGGTGNMTGTSMASPHVAGAAAQLLAAGTSPGNVRTTLTSSAEDIGLAGFEQGAGLLDVAGALGYGSANDLLEVETDPAFGITRTDAVLDGTLTQLTGSPSADVFFEWGPGGGPPFPNTTGAGNLTSPGGFTAPISGLPDDTSFQFRAGATNDGGAGSTEYGDIRSFSTDANAKPTASFTVSPSNPNVGEPVTFTSTSTDPDGDPLVHDWDFGDGDTDTGPATSHPYSTNSSFTVTLTVEDPFGAVDTAQATFVVNGYPTAAFTATPGDPIVGETVSFDAGGSSDPEGDPLSYDWDLDGDGSLGDASIETPSNSYASSGPVTVSLEVTDDNAASDLTSASLTVLTPAEAIDALIDDVEALGLNKGIENSLTKKLENAEKSLAKGRTAAAKNTLDSFIREVEAQRGKKLTDAEADALIATAQRIIDAL